MKPTGHLFTRNLRRIAWPSWRESPGAIFPLQSPSKPVKSRSTPPPQPLDPPGRPNIRDAFGPPTGPYPLRVSPLLDGMNPLGRILGVRTFSPRIRVRLQHDYFPSELGAALRAFAASYDNERYHESLDNVPPADICFGRQYADLTARDKIKRLTMKRRKKEFLAQNEG